MASDSLGDTQTQILDAAERLFAEQGFGATSLRSIIRAADVNLAAIHYHFGSKEKLIVAAINRMAQPIVASEIQQLKALEAAESPPSVEAIFRAMFAPALETMYLEGGEKGPVQARFMGWCRTEPAIEPIAAEAFSLSNRVFTEALGRSLPDQSKIEIKWKLDFAVSMLVRVLCAAHQPDAVLQGNSPEDIEQAIQRMVRFAAAGMRA